MNVERARTRLRETLEKRDITATQLAKYLGLSEGYFRDFLNEKKNSISHDAATRGAKRLEVEADWLLGSSDVMFLEPTDRPSGSGPLPSPHLLPVYRPQVTIKRSTGFLFDRVAVTEMECPPQLLTVKGAYALQVRGSWLVPRFPSGSTLYIDPSIAPRVGAMVLARVFVDGALYGHIGEYVSEADKLVLQKLGTDDRFDFPARDVEGIDFIRSASFF